MSLNDIKKSMATLDETLARTTPDNIRINSETSHTAQQSIGKRFRQNFIVCSILSIVYLLTWEAGASTLTPGIRTYLISYLAIAAFWYLFLWKKTQQLNLSASTLIAFFKEVSTLRLYHLTGEIFLSIGLTVFFTLFLPKLFAHSLLAFWCAVTTLAVGIILSIVIHIPRIIKEYHNLTSTL